MKASALDHRKRKKLSRLLAWNRRETIGLLETLFLITAIQTPQGDIGKLSDNELSDELDLGKDYDRVIAALVESEWLDVSKAHRYLVHDWHEHCPNYVKGNLSRHGRRFYTEDQDLPGSPPSDPPSSLPGSLPCTPAMESAKQPTMQPANTSEQAAVAVCYQALPNHTSGLPSPGVPSRGRGKPRQAKPSLPGERPPGAPADDGPDSAATADAAASSEPAAVANNEDQPQPPTPTTILEASIASALDYLTDREGHKAKDVEKLAQIVTTGYSHYGPTLCDHALMVLQFEHATDIQRWIRMVLAAGDQAKLPRPPKTK